VNLSILRYENENVKLVVSILKQILKYVFNCGLGHLKGMKKNRSSMKVVGLGLKILKVYLVAIIALMD